MKRILFGIFFILFFYGCTTIPKSSNSFMVTIFSPAIKINDVGFLHKDNQSTNLQIYSSGVNTVNIKISNKICINSVCYKKDEFNEKFLGTLYYDEIFEQILDKQPIFNGKNLIKNECGFNQEIKEIKYEICGKNMKFTNSKTRLKIIIKELI